MPKIGDFRRDFTENLHIKYSNFFSPLKSWRIFLPESEISCTSYERFGFYSPNKIVTFCVSENFEFFWKTRKIGDFRRDFTENRHIKLSNFFSPLKSGRIFLPESEISCTSYERFGFYGPNKIVTFRACLCQCL